MFTILFHRQSLFQDILILQDSTAVVQAANLSFQASGFGCSPGRDVILYFAEPRTLTFTVDLIGGVQHHPAQQACNGSHHHHLHPPHAHHLSGQVSFGQTSVFALLTLPATAPEYGFKEENEISCWTGDVDNVSN